MTGEQESVSEEGRSHYVNLFVLTRRSLMGEEKGVKVVTEESPGTENQINFLNEKKKKGTTNTGIKVSRER